MISVLLPFRNAQETIFSCLSSIRYQTFPHFEIIAINDHSEDISEHLVKLFPDSRIRCLDNPGRGLVDALNFGLKNCRFDLVARMDADDLMRKSRLECQWQHFQRADSLQLSSSRVALFSDLSLNAGYLEYMRWQNQILSPKNISDEIFVESPFAHPSVMFRKKTIQQLGGYRLGHFPEDYDLWFRLFLSNYKMEKLPDTLLDWRESESRTSRQDPRYDRSAFDRLRAHYLRKYLDTLLASQSSRKVYFWGAGRKTRKRAQHLINKGITPSAWVDVDPKKIGHIINNVPVYAPNQLSKKETRPLVLVYVTNHGAKEKIGQYLQSLGYEPGTDYISVG